MFSKKNVGYGPEIGVPFGISLVVAAGCGPIRCDLILLPRAQVK